MYGMEKVHKMSASRYLVLFSGGKDSFLTACRLASYNNRVVLLSINGGSVACEENFRHGANRLIKRYNGLVEYAGVYPTAAVIASLNRHWIYYTQQELGERYPNITNCQFQCLHCQTAMWIAAIAYCKAKGIKHIASGCKATDIFCTGITEYLSRIEKIANDNGIDITFPLWELTDDWERDLEMERYSFMSSVYEPKCLIGSYPKDGKLTKEEQNDMINYFDTELSCKIQPKIDDLSSILRYIKLGDRTFEPLDYPEISGEDGIY